jgi:hypothetical protein
MRQVPDNDAADGNANQGAEVSPKDRVESVPDQIHRKDAERDSPAPFGAARQTKSGEPTGCADCGHEHDGPMTELLKLRARVGSQPPNRFQDSTGKREREHDEATDQRPGREENHQKFDADRQTYLFHAFPLSESQERIQRRGKQSVLVSPRPLWGSRRTRSRTAGQSDR